VSQPLTAGTRVNRYDLFLVYLRSFLLQSAWNFERGLNYGFAFALAPVLRKLYLESERPRSFQRHLEYFSTQPYLGAFILGAVVRMEIERAQADPSEAQRRAEEIHALKVGMMGPVAAMGDSLFWATYRPFCAILAVGLAFSGALPPGKYALLAPLVFLLVYNAGHLGIRTLGFQQGLLLGDQVVLSLRKYGFQEATQGLRLAASLALGVLIVLVNRPQDGPYPGLFLLKMTFFGAVLALYTFALRKKVGPSQVFYGVVLFALLLAYWPKLYGQTGAVGGFFPFMSPP